MKNNKTFKLTYNKGDDILYISRGGLTKEDTSEELGEDIIMWMNKKTHELSGFTILNFSRISSKSSKTVTLPVDFQLHATI